MAELNALNVINERLQTKTPVKKTRVQVEHETVCPYNVMGPPEANMSEIGVLLRGEGGTCKTIRREIVEAYHDTARATTSEFVAVSNLVIDSANPRALPEKALLAWQDYTNCADAQLSVGI